MEVQEEHVMHRVNDLLCNCKVLNVGTVHEEGVLHSVHKEMSLGVGGSSPSFLHPRLWRWQDTSLAIVGM